MAAPSKAKGGGGKLTRSQTVTVRLDPKLRYLGELAARKQRRTLSSYIEWAIEESLKSVLLDEGNGYNNDQGSTVHDEVNRLWDVDEADRFAKLALRYPELLTHDEQVTWKLIKENGALWRSTYVSGNSPFNEDNLIFQVLRKHWDNFNSVARGEADASVLPAWTKDDVKSNPGFDDDIPF